MAKKAIYWSYSGYLGDEFTFDSEKLTNKFFPGSRSTKVKFFSWLSQKGFGPGYFNNSGVYRHFQKTMVDEAFEVPKHYLLTIYADDVAYFDAMAEIKTAEKRMRKQNPY